MTLTLVCASRGAAEALALTVWDWGYTPDLDRDARTVTLVDVLDCNARDVVDEALERGWCTDDAAAEALPVSV